MRPLPQYTIASSPTRSLAMRLRDPNSGYNGCDTFPTPSQTPIKCSGGSNTSGHGSSGGGCSDNDDDRRIAATLKLHRSTSLDSLANSWEQGSSGCNSNNNSTTDDIGQLSDVDSINEFVDAKSAGVQLGQRKHGADDKSSKSVRPSSGNHCKVSSNVHGPIITAYLEKSHRKCEYKNCALKEKECVDDEQIVVDHVNNGLVTNVHLRSSDASETDITDQQQKLQRRLSVTSSGSIGRMETIIEEPIEPKISVKEILARFETLNSLEVRPDIVLLFVRFNWFEYVERERGTMNHFVESLGQLATRKKKIVLYVCAGAPQTNQCVYSVEPILHSPNKMNMNDYEFNKRFEIPHIVEVD